MQLSKLPRYLADEPGDNDATTSILGRRLFVSSSSIISFFYARVITQESKKVLFHHQCEDPRRSYKSLAGLDLQGSTSYVSHAPALERHAEMLLSLGGTRSSPPHGAFLSQALVARSRKMAWKTVQVRSSCAKVGPSPDLGHA